MQDARAPPDMLLCPARSDAPPMPEPLEDLDALCRRALVERRLDAFDNVDVERFLAEPIDPSRALWIGRHLMRNGRALASFTLGQEIVRRCTPATTEAAD